MKHREIKFRALDNMGKIHYGYYRYIKYSPVNGKFINQDTIHNGNYDALINTNTLGQYVGRKDKNGKEIYEKDKVKDAKGNEFLVKFNSDFCAFFLHPLSDLNAFIGFYPDIELEIIGNELF